jgi:hypothetical protein
VTRKALAPTIRSAAVSGDVGALARAARAAGPDELARAWPKLPAVGRVAAFRALDARAAAKLFAALPYEARWIAYLGCLSEGAATLLEGATAAERRELRRTTPRELAAMRRALARDEA